MWATSSGIGLVLLAGLAISLIGPARIAAVDRESLAAGLLFDRVVMTMLALGNREPIQRCWRITATGIERWSTGNRFWSIRSDEVDAVGWLPTTIMVRSGEDRIFVKRDGMNTADWQRVREQCRVLLASRFNLPADRDGPDRLGIAFRRFPRGCLVVFVLVVIVGNFVPPGRV